MSLVEEIRKSTRKVTKKWTQARKAEERGRSRACRNYIYADRVSFSDVAAQIIPEAYQHASGDGRYPVAKRQLFYACRERFRRATGNTLDYGYFSQTLLVQYLNRHPDDVADWKITADPRGTLILPHLAETIPAGTLAIENYLREHVWHPDPISLSEIDVPSLTRWPGRSPCERYQAVMYIEKEGFTPLLQAAGIANRYNLAILSCKGQSVVAARKFIDHVCHEDGVPLLAVHDCDKAGFEIAQRLTSVSDWAREQDRITYEFQHTIVWQDLGLKLDDAERFDLAEEQVTFKGRFAPDSICTDAEKAFLRSGRRIELNAFTSPQFIEWLEQMLAAAGIQEGWIPPDDELLTRAYRRAMVVNRLQAILDEERDKAVRQAESAPVEGLREQLRQRAKRHPERSWDQHLSELARDRCEI